jgi:hypothetical protein
MIVEIGCMSEIDVVMRYVRNYAKPTFAQLARGGSKPGRFYWPWQRSDRPCRLLPIALIPSRTRDPKT